MAEAEPGLDETLLLENSTSVADEDAEEESDGDDDGSTITESTVMSQTTASSEAGPRPPGRNTVIRLKKETKAKHALDAQLHTANFLKASTTRKAGTFKPERGRTPPKRQTRVDDHLKPMAHPFAAPSSSQERRKIHHQIAAWDEAPDLENVIHFCYWGKDNFKVLYELFRAPDATGKYLSCRAVPVEEFVAYISRCGFKGDPISIVREVFKCAPPGVIAMINQSSVGAPAYELTIPMIQKFMRKFEHLSVGEDWAPVNEFKKLLRELRGSKSQGVVKTGAYLRAWRLDIDLCNTGTVSYMTFIQACHKLERGRQSQAIWNAFRPDATTMPLEFSEFAPKEAANLEAFIQTMWVSCQFNMYKAWEVIDVTERLWVSEEEFVEGAEKLGFMGDAQAVFRGLDTYGLGRLWRRELEYLKILFNSSSRTPHGTPQIKVLRAWSQSAFAGPEGFLSRLGMTEDRADLALSPAQFASALEQLGYPGDPREAAHLVDRAAGIDVGITRELLLRLVGGERPNAPPYIQRTIKSFKETTNPRRSRSQPATKKELEMKMAQKIKEGEDRWNNSVQDLCLRNEDRCRQHRSYFSDERPLRSGEVSKKFRETTPVVSPKFNNNMRVSFKVEPPAEKVEVAKKDKKEKKSKKSKKKSKGDDEEEDEDEEREERRRRRKDKKEKKEKTEKREEDEEDEEASGNQSKEAEVKVQKSEEGADAVEAAGAAQEEAEDEEDEDDEEEEDPLDIEGGDSF